MDKLDRNIVRLVDTLNSFKGVRTHGSCGGHKNPTPAQWTEGSFYVKFFLDWDENGRFSLEFLAYVINDYLRVVEHKGIILYPYAAPPYLNTPGEMLDFVIEGYNGMKPTDLATVLMRMKSNYFCSPEEVAE